MTKLTKAISREVKAVEPRSLKPFVVTMDTHVVRIREKRGRAEYVISYEDIYYEAAKRRGQG